MLFAAKVFILFLPVKNRIADANEAKKDKWFLPKLDVRFKVAYCRKLKKKYGFNQNICSCPTYASFPKKPILWEKEKKKRRLVTNRASQRTRTGTLSKAYGDGSLTFSIFNTLRCIWVCSKKQSNSDTLKSGARVALYSQAPDSQPQGHGFESQSFLLQSKWHKGPPISGGAKIRSNPREKPFKHSFKKFNSGLHGYKSNNNIDHYLTWGEEAFPLERSQRRRIEFSCTQVGHNMYSLSLSLSSAELIEWRSRDKGFYFRVLFTRSYI